MAQRVIETERKYELPARGGIRLNDLPGITADADPQRQLLDAIYYDTADLRLARRAVTLRRRSGGSDAGWHLKLPERDRDSRVEIRTAPTSSNRQVPAELSELVLGLTRGEPLTPVAHIRTERRQWTLRDERGIALAEFVADAVSAQTMGASSTTSAWKEAEVELIGGDRSVFTAVERRLGPPSDAPAKLLRVLGARIAPTRPAKTAVAAYCRTQVDEIVRQDARVRRDLPDAVHRMRVAARRLRSVLRAFRWSPSVRTELKWLAGVLGAARDLEVLHADLAGQVRALPDELVLGPVQRRLTETFAAREAKARRDLLEALCSTRYFALLDELESLRIAPLRRQERDRALRRTRRRVERAFARVERRGTEHGLHEVRKAAKRSRYTAEATGHPKAARTMKNLQEMLGIHHDSAVAAAELRRLGVQEHLAGANGFTYGVLYGMQRQRMSDIERDLPRA